MEAPYKPVGDSQSLIKMENGDSEIGVRQPSPPTATVTRELRRILVDRWPEVVSAYWITLFVFGITVMICYSLGLRTLSVRNGGTNSTGTVCYHQIVQIGRYWPFDSYSQFLSTMAQEYPSLRFNIYFLIEDPLRSPYYQRNPIYFNGGIGYLRRDEFDESNKQRLIEFQRDHPNVNFTIMCLSKYMAMTPLRYKWRNIPTSYLPFYARVFDVWQHGGIGMDLSALNNRYSYKHLFNQRIKAILKNHNDGLSETDYNIVLKAFPQEREQLAREKCLKSKLNDQSLAHTLAILYNLLSYIVSPTNFGLNVPTLSQKPKFLTKLQPDKFEIPAGNTVLDNAPNLLKSNTTNGRLLNALMSPKANDSNVEPFNHTAAPESDLTEQKPPSKNLTHGVNATDAESSHIVIFYDFSVTSDHFGRSMSEPLASEFDGNATQKKKEAHLAMDPDGVFIAASDKLHRFLGTLVSAGFHKLRPHFAIQDTFVSQCSGLYSHEAYCNIYGL